MSAPIVSVVVIGYRRPKHLEQTVNSFLQVNRWLPLELILADDGSPADEQERMRLLPFDKFVFSPSNRGLGANTNAGISVARGRYILQLQDDWLCHGPGDFLARGIDVLVRRPEIGLLRFTNRNPELEYDRVDLGNGVLRVYCQPPRRRDQFLYTDTPHLKSRECIDTIGPYLEARHMQKTEIDMCKRWNSQTRFRAAFLEGYDVFEHIGGDASFNRPLFRARVSSALERVPGLGGPVRTYRRAKAWWLTRR